MLVSRILYWKYEYFELMSECIHLPMLCVCVSECGCRLLQMRIQHSNQQALPKSIHTHLCLKEYIPKGVINTYCDENYSSNKTFRHWNSSIDFTVAEVWLKSVATSGADSFSRIFLTLNEYRLKDIHSANYNLLTWILRARHFSLHSWMFSAKIKIHNDRQYTFAILFSDENFNSFFFQANFNCIFEYSHLLETTLLRLRIVVSRYQMWKFSAIIVSFARNSFDRILVVLINACAN